MKKGDIVKLIDSGKTDKEIIKEFTKVKAAVGFNYDEVIGILTEAADKYKEKPEIFVVIEDITKEIGVLPTNILEAKAKVKADEERVNEEEVKEKVKVIINENIKHEPTLNLVNEILFDEHGDVNWNNAYVSLNNYFPGYKDIKSKELLPTTFESTVWYTKELKPLINKVIEGREILDDEIPEIAKGIVEDFQTSVNDELNQYEMSENSDEEYEIYYKVLNEVVKQIKEQNPGITAKKENEIG